VSTATDGRG